MVYSKMPTRQKRKTQRSLKTRLPQRTPNQNQTIKTVHQQLHQKKLRAPKNNLLRAMPKQRPQKKQHHLNRHPLTRQQAKRLQQQHRNKRLLPKRLHKNRQLLHNSQTRKPPQRRSCPQNRLHPNAVQPPGQRRALQQHVLHHGHRHNNLHHAPPHPLLAKAEHRNLQQTSQPVRPLDRQFRAAVNQFRRHLVPLSHVPVNQSHHPLEWVVADLHLPDPVDLVVALDLVGDQTVDRVPVAHHHVQLQVGDHHSRHPAVDLQVVLAAVLPDVVEDRATSSVLLAARGEGVVTVKNSSQWMFQPIRQPQHPFQKVLLSSNVGQHHKILVPS